MRTQTSNFLINIVSLEYHVPETEIYTRTIKDCARSTLASIHRKHIPKHMLTELVFGQVLWLNAFPNKNGVFSTLSTQTIVKGKDIRYT